METFIPSLKNVSCQRFKTQPRELKKYILLMISNGLRWHYIAITKLSILLKGKTSPHVEIKSPAVLECLLKKVRY